MEVIELINFPIHFLSKSTIKLRLVNQFLHCQVTDSIYRILQSFEVEKFRGFRGLTGDRETFPVKDFPTGNFLKNGRRHYTGERGIAIPIQLHEC